MRIPRQRAIHRYQDILMFSCWFGFPVTISSCARSVLEMRSVPGDTGLCTFLGMDEPDVEQALNGIGKVMEPADHVRPGDQMSPRPPTMREKRRYLLARDRPGWFNSPSRRISIMRYPKRSAPCGETA